MISLPKTDLYFPLVRFLVMPPGSWGGATQPWVVLNQPQRYGFEYLKPYGYELQSVERVSLPAIGRAEFIYRYGNMTSTGKNLVKTVPAPLDLTGYHVRIQAAPYVDPKEGPLVWRTIFLGTVDSFSDSPWNGAESAGNRTYFCSDLLYRTARWPLDKHGLYQDNTQYIHASGHPGYNYKIAGFFRRLMGNKGTSTVACPWGDGTSYSTHAWPGSTGAQLWGDDEVLNHALASSRAKGEPTFTLKNPGLLQGNTYAWPVSEGEKCWDLLIRILSRQRGRGVSFLDWADDPCSTNNFTDIVPLITMEPQNKDDIIYRKPSGGGNITITQALSQGTAIDVDLQGDHRYVDDSLQLVTNDSSGVDYLETRGEQIEVLVTLSGKDSTLEKRWSDDDEATFLGISSSVFWQRTSTRWRHVFQRWSLPVGWDFKVGDGNGGTKSSCHYACLSTGAIVSRDIAGTLTPSSTEYVPAASPLTVKIGGDIPIYEGYDYASSSPGRYDGATDYLTNPRNPAMILVLTDVPNLYLNGAEYLGMGLQNDDFGVLIQYPNDQAAGTRFWSGAGSVVGGAFGVDRLVLSASLTLSNRVRMSSSNLNPNDSNNPYTDITAGRKLYINVPGACLWLAHPSAIWEHNVFAATDKAAPAKRNAAGGSGEVPGLLRDDRDALAMSHAFAWAWYGTKRVSASWALKDCGFLPWFTGDPAGGTSRQSIKYPQLGQLVKTVSAAGTSLQKGATTVDPTTSYKVNTPITRVHYNHVNGVTTWFTDWQDLDTESL
jgi:hypothetical protein